VNIYAIAILVSLLIYIVVGNYAGRKIRNLDDYMVAGRNAPTILIVGTLVASTISTGSFIGDTGFVYQGYTTSQIFGFVPIAVVGFTIGGLFFGRYLRRSRVHTLAEFFGNRFASPRLRMLAALTMVIGMGAYLLAVNQGVAIVIEGVADVSYPVALLVVWLGYTTFTIYGGSRGVVLTDTMMFLFFTVIAFIGLGYIVGSGGGWFQAMESLAAFEPQPEIISAAGRSGSGSPWASSFDLWMWSIILGLSWAIAFSISPWQSSRYLMARDEHVVMRSACLSTCILAMTWPIIYYSGAAVALSNPDIVSPENPIVWSAMNIMPPLIGAMLLAGIVAAGLSSASTFLSLIGFAISNDLVQSRSVDQRKLVWLSRVAILIASITVIVIASLVPPSVFWITQFAGPMFAAAWGPIAFASIWSKRVTEPAAFWGMLAGLLGLISAKSLQLSGLVVLPSYLDPLLLGAVLSMITIVAVSMRTQVTGDEAAYREKLHRPPPELADPDASRKTLIWPKVMIAFGAVSIPLMMVFYVRPFQIGAGLIDSSHPFVTWSGETLLAILFGSIIAIGGWIAYRFAKRIYATGI